MHDIYIYVYIYLYNHILFHSAQIPNRKGQIHPAAPSPGRLATAGTLGALHELRNDGRKEDQDGATHQHLRTFLGESVIQPWGEVDLSRGAHVQLGCMEEGSP